MNALPPHAPKVIIIGAGIAGPTLAIFLKLNGYNPVIYERQHKISPGGVALALQPNGLRVLDMIPGLVSKISGSTVDSFQFYSVEPSDSGLLASTQILADLVERGELRHPWITVMRPRFQALIRAEATDVYNIPIIYDHCVDGVVENTAEETVSVHFTNGLTDTASFVVGCDGLHSITRRVLFGKDEAQYTGMTQMGGHSPFPNDKTLWRGMTNIFGDGLHFISYPTSEETIGWIITQHEGEARETWKPMDIAGQDQVRQGEYSKLPYGVGEVVRSCNQIIKYGLYDRPELESWYSGRIVLLGDAAHPTSPHLGQGANQAFEDIYHLVRLLNLHTSPPHPSNATLKTVFEEYTTKRLARTSALTKGARAQGELRLVHGAEACVARNQRFRSLWGDKGPMIKGYVEVWKGTFDEGAGADELLVRMSNQR
ncbi:FAD/NAD(P)-binding domain-containing protein [Clavulina sp. PMI_390]|nr:FAD/NAD(P)-binding domain-containing protein [Clavulina sp. PMI_390]